MQPRWLKFFGLLAGWIFVGFVLSFEVYFNLRAGASMTMAPMEFWTVATPQLVRAAMWACMAPLILQMVDKLPLTTGRWVGGITFHFLASFVVMATFYLGRLLGYVVFEGEPLKGFWQMAANGFYGRNIIDMAFYWAVIAYGYMKAIYRKYKTEEVKGAQLETKLVEAELKALRQQLHPHFLFNTMHTIAVLVREGKNSEAVTLLARLSTLLRVSLDNTGVPEITLRQEMEFLDRYLEIQKTRFSDRLRVNISISPDAMQARIPNLLLQPIVENAIVHGVAPKSGPGQVDVLGRVENGNLYLSVRDDGPGFDGAVRAREGIGLANTRERLSKIYGAQGHLSLKSHPGRGVTVQMTLPYRT